MKRAIECGITAGALLAALCGAALAWEEPEAAYAKYQRAALTGDEQQMMRFWTSARRAQVAALPEARRQYELASAGAAVPLAYTLQAKSVSRDGQSARLVLAAAGDAFAEAKPEPMYGSVRMVLEGGAWKVAEARWSKSPPAGLAQPRAAGAQAPAAVPVRDMTRPAGRPVQANPPVLRPGTPGCVYKAVMTDEEISRCR